MTPTSTERRTPRTPDARRRNVDQAIYLRTYDVINSLDRAERMPWWEKALGGARRFQPQIPKRALAAPQLEMKALPPVYEAEETGASKPLQAKTPALNFWPIEAERHQTALAAIDLPVIRSMDPPERTISEGRQISWALLALVAVITAGLTFAIIHFAWPSLSVGAGESQPKHAATYVTTRSEVRSGQSQS